MNKKPIVKNYMATRLVILSETMDVYFAIALLLKNKISGAPVINDANQLVGILSEKDCLRVFANGSFHNMPGGDVGNFMTKTVATVTPEMDLFMVADVFLKHNYRRMPVVVEDKIVGQISRRDVLRAIQDGSSHKIDKNEINGYITQEMKGSLSK